MGAGAVVVTLPTHRRAAQREICRQHARQRGGGPGAAPTSYTGDLLY